MEAKRKRLTLDLEPIFQQPLKADCGTQRCQHAMDTAKPRLSGSWHGTKPSALADCCLTNQTIELIAELRWDISWGHRPSPKTVRPIHPGTISLSTGV